MARIARVALRGLGRAGARAAGQVSTAREEEGGHRQGTAPEIAGGGAGRCGRRMQMPETLPVKEKEETRGWRVAGRGGTPPMIAGMASAAARGRRKNNRGAGVANSRYLGQAAEKLRVGNGKSILRRAPPLQAILYAFAGVYEIETYHLPLPSRKFGKIGE